MIKVRPIPTYQQGIVLVITLIMLFILATLAITISNIPNNDQRAAGNLRDQTLAKQAANAAILEAQLWIQRNWINNQSLPNMACVKPVRPTGFSIDNYSNNLASWWSTNGCNTNLFPSNVSQPPIYIIKYLGADGSHNVDLYHVIARGTGASPTTIAYSEKIIQKGVTATTVSAGTPGARLITLVNGPKGGNAVTQTAYLGYGTAFGNSGWGGVWGGWCAQGVPSFAGCSRNSIGYVQVFAYSGNDSPACHQKYGPWVPPGDSGKASSVTIKTNSNTVTVSCY